MKQIVLSSRNQENQPYKDDDPSDLSKHYSKCEKLYQDCKNGLVSMTNEDGEIAFHPGGVGFGLEIIEQELKNCLPRFLQNLFVCLFVCCRR